ncbi:MAG: MotA/TolQ/ExbB proton channel family protein [Kiritimatiellia bacterium]|jgi:biopolymer transport protein TolQ
MFSSLLPPSLPLALVGVDALFLAYRQSDPIGKGIVLVQIGISVVAWCVMISKGRRLNETFHRATAYRNLFNEASHSMELYRSGRSSPDPLETIYRAACERLAKLFGPTGLESWLRGDVGVRGLGDSELELVRSATENTLYQQKNEIESGMSILATAVTAAPLLGLLGTVLGVLMAFQSMARSGSALLSDVAPALSSAMLTTVVGLLVAIPTAIGYNWLQAKIENIAILMDGFTDDLNGRIGCDFRQR